ncbi:MAG: hypothetical protein K6A35_02200 [bacterium]|jgi:F0F1-type ATP synthase membrane subunit b/b'|nr:hypothetical protein [bacterium]
MTNYFEFVCGVLNIVLLAIVFKYVIFGSLRQAAQDKTMAVKARVNEAKDILQQAQEQAKFWKDKAQHLPEELEQIASKAQEDADRVLREGQERTDNEVSVMLASAKREAEILTARACNDVQTRIAQKVTERAEAIIRRSLDEQIEQNIIEDFLNKMGVDRA